METMVWLKVNCGCKYRPMLLMRVFKNVVAQFIGQMRLMNQATTEILG